MRRPTRCIPPQAPLTLSLPIRTPQSSADAGRRGKDPDSLENLGGFVARGCSRSARRYRHPSADRRLHVAVAPPTPCTLILSIFARSRDGGCVVSKENDDKSEPAPEVEPTRAETPPLMAVSSVAPTEDRYDAALLDGLKFIEEPSLTRRQDPLLEIVKRIQIGDTAEGVQALRHFMKLVDDSGERNQLHRLADIESRQGNYLAVSGTLTQFNGILAAALGGALATLQLGSLKFAFSAALVLHVLAAAVLCWAARPMATKREPTPTMTYIGQVALVVQTFLNYQRGWRMTMLALLVTAIAGALLGLQILGISLPLSLLFGA